MADVSYRKQIQPLIAARCEACHRSGAAVVLSSYEGLRKAAPRLVDAVSGDPPRMPKAGAPLDASEVATIRQWVAEGAKNDGPADLWWSFRPLPENTSTHRSIDEFIAAKLGPLKPSPEADKRTLIRRLYVDLHGGCAT